MARAAAESLGEVNADSVVCADLSVLPFRAGAFDVVFSTATFHWILNHDRLFREIHRVLCAGGQLEAQCGGGPNLALVHARADALAAGSPFRPYFARWREPWRFASAGETEACLERCGFTSAHCWLEEAPARFTDADHYRAFLETVVMRPYLARLAAPELRHRFLDRLVTMAAADEAPFTLDYWRLNISAKA
jgi:trans-aconitate 2-methyltransferase